ncbi:MAG: MFS transporter [Gammaproteobacteria bacterium]|nr:MFS transporter [Gammaproteobacteria bacterium]
MHIPTNKPTIPRGVWALGLVSLFMDVSSEIIHGLLPVFLVTVIGANVATVGLVEGLGEAVALIVRVLSGALSDRMPRRKPLIVAGYLLGTLSKPLFALAQGTGLVITARVSDRIGKGLRGAPRDALVADLTPAAIHGAAYGLRQTLDSLGAFLGPLLGIILMFALNNAYRTVFWLALIPGFISVTILILLVREPGTQTRVKPNQSRVLFGNFRLLSRAYWVVLVIGIVFTLARFSEAFLLLRAEKLGLAPHWVPGILLIMSLFFALTAYPAGHLSDRVGRIRMLIVGLVFLIVADLVLAFANQVAWVVVGASLWGVHMGFTQGLFSALIADTATAELRGTAFGIYGLATGLAVLFASVFAGWLWDLHGPQTTFLAGVGFSLLTLIALLYYQGQRRHPRHVC